MSDTEAPVACTLEATAYINRLADIRNLVGRALKASRREGLSLYLTFEPEARSDVEEMVAKEKACCAFLDFQITHGAGGTKLTITVPPGAVDSADELFAVFAQAKPVHGCGCSP